MSTALLAALMGADGATPAKITRVEIDILESGDCRWTLFGEDRRLFSALARPADQAAMLRDTGILLNTETAARRGAN